MINGKKAHGMDLWQRQFLKEAVLEAGKKEGVEGTAENARTVLLSLYK